MEFQSLGILPIACEMRTLEHLHYTPAPDIVHEAAGHAPIIADPEYARYLREYGEISRKAIFSSQDMAVYEAIRSLSDIKEDPASTPAQIAEAQRTLDECVARLDYDSEASLMSRMNWWTVEYGLIGSLDAPKIYGAGLLSSVGESYDCLSDGVKKLPFTLDCINVAYDITRPQPQLFVARDFTELSRVLEEFAALMAFRTGGLAGLEKARRAGSLTTTELDSGIQVSGVLTRIITDGEHEPAFLKYDGPSQLSHQDRQLEGQGPERHPHGFSSPIGPLAGGRSSAELSEEDLRALGFEGDRPGRMRFASGIELDGVLRQQIRKHERNLVLTFDRCTVRRGDEALFQPDWGAYDLACGARVTSVFGGAGDRSRYVTALGGFAQKPRKPKSNLTEANRELNALYAAVRQLREAGAASPLAASELGAIARKLDESHVNDWLLRLELLELDSAWKLGADWAAGVSARLEEIARRDADVARMIRRGLELL
jgi:phenylalanine-4-hydroxylase